jgi:hypothetical protein
MGVRDEEPQVNLSLDINVSYESLANHLNTFLLFDLEKKKRKVLTDICNSSISIYCQGARQDHVLPVSSKGPLKAIVNRNKKKWQDALICIRYHEFKRDKG